MMTLCTRLSICTHQRDTFGFSLMFRISLKRLETVFIIPVSKFVKFLKKFRQAKNVSRVCETVKNIYVHPPKH